MDPIKVRRTSRALKDCKRLLEVAEDEMRQLNATNCEQKALLEQYETELSDLSAGRGEKVLAAIREGDGTKETRTSSRLLMAKQFQVDTVIDVLAVLKVKRKEMRITVADLKANCLYAEADALDKQAKNRQVRTDDLLVQLKEHEGVNYVPAPPEQPESRVTVPGEGPKFGAVASTHGDPVPISSSRTGGISMRPVVVVITIIPITQNLRRQADFFRAAGKALLDNVPMPTDILTGLLLFPLPEYLQ